MQSLELGGDAEPFASLILSGHSRIDGRAQDIPPERYVQMTG
jgi:hypothetical protein